jgi:hypothetical protein
MPEAASVQHSANWVDAQPIRAPPKFISWSCITPSDNAHKESIREPRTRDAHAQRYGFIHGLSSNVSQRLSHISRYGRNFNTGVAVHKRHGLCGITNLLQRPINQFKNRGRVLAAAETDEPRNARLRVLPLDES